FPGDHVVPVEWKSLLLLSSRALWRNCANDCDRVFLGVILKSTGQSQRLKNRERFFVGQEAGLLNLSGHKDAVTLDGLEYNRHVRDIQHVQEPLFDRRLQLLRTES